MPSSTDQALVPGYDHIYAYVDVDNVGSMMLLEKVGFTRGAVQQDEYVAPQLGMRDAVMFYLPRPE